MITVHYEFIIFSKPKNNSKKNYFIQIFDNALTASWWACLIIRRPSSSIFQISSQFPCPIASSTNDFIFSLSKMSCWTLFFAIMIWCVIYKSINKYKYIWKTSVVSILYLTKDKKMTYKTKKKHIHIKNLKIEHLKIEPLLLYIHMENFWAIFIFWQLISDHFYSRIKVIFGKYELFLLG